MTDTSEKPDPLYVHDEPGQDIPTDDTQTEGSGSRQSLTGELRGLIDDFQAVVESEIDFHKARISYTVSQSKHISLLLVGVGVFGSVATMALVLGLLLALIPIVGEWWALAIVTLSCLAIAVICFMLATRKTRRIQSLFTNKDKGDEE